MRMAVLFGGLANIRIALPSAVARPRSAPLALLLKRLWTYAISVLLLRSLVFPSRILINPPSSLMITTLVSSGLTT